ncbi:hypothetical protein [Actinoplanes sp. CA-252034]|uniref:hypothetical protein n=1 Tax=Actinoplanes sp. CA-252034 TaxID=3239906 RepID=UPI003D99EC81
MPALDADQAPGPMAELVGWLLGGDLDAPEPLAEQRGLAERTVSAVYSGDPYA